MGFLGGERNGKMKLERLRERFFPNCNPNPNPRPGMCAKLKAVCKRCVQGHINRSTLAINTSTCVFVRVRVCVSVCV